VANARVTRGRKAQRLAAELLQRTLFPAARSVEASLPGKDILGTPGLSIEMKATSQADLTGALRQASRNADTGDVPVVVYRPLGYGPERINDWLVAFRFGDAIDVLGRAGYGD
jgi:hypothetical protein